MNIVTAPLALVVSTFSPFVRGFRPPSAPMYFLAVSTLLAIAVVGFGLKLAFAGSAGDINIRAMGFEISTQAGGIALTALGLLFYLAIGKMIMGKDD